MRQHPFTVFAQPVANLRRRYAVRIGQLRIQGHTVDLFRQILTADTNQDSAAVVLLEGFVVALTPGNISTHATIDGNVDGWQAASDLYCIPANKVAGRVGFIEFLAEDAGTLRPQMRIHEIIERAFNHTPGVKHQVLADKP